jgi:hypothetical protein
MPEIALHRIPTQRATAPAEIADALKQEQARHDNVIRNMQRLRELRLSRDANGSETIGTGHQSDQSSS